MQERKTQIDMGFFELLPLIWTESGRSVYFTFILLYPELMIVIISHFLELFRIDTG